MVNSNESSYFSDMINFTPYFYIFSKVFFLNVISWAFRTKKHSKGIFWKYQPVRIYSKSLENVKTERMNSEREKE